MKQPGFECFLKILLKNSQKIPKNDPKLANLRPFSRTQELKKWLLKRKPPHGGL